MKKMIAVLLVTLVAAATAQTVEHTFTRADVPQFGQIRLANVDFSTTQDIDVNLPANLRYVLGDTVVQSVTVNTLSSGAVMGVSEVTTAGAAVRTLAHPKTLGVVAAGAIEELTPVAASAGGAAYAVLRGVAAATTSGAFTTVTNLSAATGGVTIASTDLTDPVHPRNVVVVITDDSGASTNLAGSVVINGTDSAGNTVSETLTMATTMTETLTGSVAFRTLTSVVYTFQNGQAADTLDMGYGDKLGLPYDTQKQGGLVIDRLIVGGTLASTVTPTTGSFVTNVADTTSAFVTETSTTTDNFVTNVTDTTGNAVTGTSTDTGSFVTNVTFETTTGYDSTGAAITNAVGDTIAFITNVSFDVANAVTGVTDITSAFVTGTSAATANAVTGVTDATANAVTETSAATANAVTGATVGTVSAAGTVEAAAATGATYGTFTPTTLPNGARDYEVYYSFNGPDRPDAIDGANRVRISITGSTATNDVKTILLNLYAF